ncbi:hypothetical protein Vadar_004442 [Vaccinium darrowii]|uniref:Uncharacterized protein n=1 Tax=Vaccinium darrowii TaxID=229202 RepID=A0ACB7YKC0_9ERIC|nr:hypothetical protein Vadar_004442 [Vaccinium darrowii]
MIHPVPGMHDYLVIGYQPLQPPLSKKQTGRPKKLRRRQADEPRDPHLASRRNINVTCAKCLGSGHNRRTCKNRIHPNSSMLKKGSWHGGFPQSTRASTQPTANVPQFATLAIHGQPKAMTQPSGKGKGGGSGRGKGRGVGNAIGRGRGIGSRRGRGLGNATRRCAGSGALVCAGNSGGRGGANEPVSAGRGRGNGAGRGGCSGTGRGGTAFRGPTASVGRGGPVGIGGEVVERGSGVARGGPITAGRGAWKNKETSLASILDRMKAKN